MFLSGFIIVYVYEAGFEYKVKKSLEAETCRQNKDIWFRSRTNRRQIIYVTKSTCSPFCVFFILIFKDKFQI